MIAFLFPGQGAQTAGFLHTLGGEKSHPCIQSALHEASEVLARDVLELDTETALESTVAVQVSLLIAGVAAARALRDEGIEPDAVAGLSVGAYGAAVVAGSIAFADALRLVQLRAELMERAYPRGYGMLAIVGFNEREVEASIHEAGGGAYIGNLNGPRQIVVSGSDAALANLQRVAVERGARRAERLAVSVPSHCVLLDEAAKPLERAAQDIAFADPSIPYIGNKGARPLRKAEAIRDDLATNMRYPVRWHDATVVLGELGAKVMLELPPGRVLTQLAEDALENVAAIAMEGTPVSATAARVRSRIVG